MACPAGNLEAEWGKLAVADDLNYIARHGHNEP